MPRSVISSNIGRLASTPRSRIALTAGGHCDRRLHVSRRVSIDHILQLQAREIRDPVGGSQRQRRPAELPCAAGARRLIESDEILVRPEADPAQMVCRRKPSLAGADDGNVDPDAHQGTREGDRKQGRDPCG
jgi:hypothetical protein